MVEIPSASEDAPPQRHATERAAATSKTLDFAYERRGHYLYFNS